MLKHILCATLLAASASHAQINYPMADDQVRSEMSASDKNHFESSEFAMTTGVAGFGIDGITRQGFDIDLRALLAKVAPARIELNAGVVVYNSAASPSELSAVGQGYLDQPGLYAGNQYSQPRFALNFALAYAGPEALFYFSSGKLRPYAAAGVQAVMWRADQGVAATLAPSARAGLEAAVSHSLNGFVEVRYLYGFPNLLNQYSTSLRYVTSVAFGMAFAPQL